MGAGKTTVAYEVSIKLRAAATSHVVIDDELALFFPRPSDDPTGEHLRTEALRSLWRTYAAAGVERIVLARALEDEAALVALREAIPDAEITVFILDASLATLYERIDQKGVPSARDWCRKRASELLAAWTSEPLDVQIVQTNGRSPADVAAEIVSRSGWL